MAASIFLYVLRRQIDQLQQDHIGGEGPIGFGYLTDLPVKAFNSSIQALLNIV